ncbi:hypothetical protein CAFE_15810 [Caprobacter fermentans]|uniref:Uncharacterized protein n=1 Tax=Caproicibacter fermentans TaxID=2576756 RepID=A0A6N8HZC7_9FIRM|nr:hypothetical protein [Caproicibacter fermentans]
MRRQDSENPGLRGGQPKTRLNLIISFLLLFPYIISRRTGRTFVRPVLLLQFENSRHSREL